MTEHSNAGERDDATPNAAAPKDEKPRANKGKDAKFAKAPEKPSERIAKVLARAGLASRREVERLIGLGKIAVNGRILDTPAVLVKSTDVITVDGQVIGKAEPTRLWRYHKPVGLVTTHRDPEGRSTVFDKLPAGLPRVISVGRLDLNSEGLLLLTNDGELARGLEKPSSGWVRRYRARALGHTTQARLDKLKDGTTVDGVIYGPMEASLDKVSEKADGRANVWLTVAITEGKNREVRKVLESIGLKVNRLIRLAYGPFQLGNLEPGDVEEVGPRVIRELLGDVVDMRNLPPEGASQTRTPGRSSRDATGADGKPTGRRGGGDRFGANRDDTRAPRKPRRDFAEKREYKDRDFDERPRFEGDGESRDRRPQREFSGPRKSFGDRPQREGWTPRPERSEGQTRTRPERSEGQKRTYSERSEGQRSTRPERSEWKPRTERGQGRPDRGEREWKPHGEGQRSGGAARGERTYTPRRDLDEAGAYARAKAEFGPGAKSGEKKPFRAKSDGWKPRGDTGEGRGAARDSKPRGEWKPRGERSEGQRSERSDRGDKTWTPRPERGERTRAPKGEGGDKRFGQKDSGQKDFAKKSYGKPGGRSEGRSFGGKSFGGKPFAGKPGGRPSGPRKPQG